MEIRNHTPLRPLVFESRDARDRPFYALVARGTYRVEAAPGAPEARLVLHTEQAPPLQADEYRGDPGASSVRAESDLAPPKPHGDLTLDAVARAPGGRPAESWTAGVRIGRRAVPEVRPRSLVGSRSRAGEAVVWERQHLARVTGPRRWVRGLVGWKAERPAPCLSVPLDYEHAFGGQYGVPGGAVHFAQNPVGAGFFDPARASGETVPMPQVESLTEPVTVPGQPYAPVGFGPLGRSWQPRITLAGTHDARWLRERSPRPPEDFQPAFHNGAPEALQLPQPFTGDETISLVGIYPWGEVAVHLPEVRVWALVRRASGGMEPLPCVLDSVHLTLADDDPAEHRAALVWRAAVSLAPPVRVLELRMALPDAPLAPEAAPPTQVARAPEARPLR